MKCDELVRFWDNYVSMALPGANAAAMAEPRHAILRELLAAYSGEEDQAAEEQMIVEPYLGDIRPANRGRVKLVMLNLNPGGADPRHQSNSGTSTFGAQLARQPYSEWAASWPYLTLPECRKWGGPFHRPRIRFAEEVTQQVIQVDEVVAFELFPWHSNRWGRLDTQKALPAIQELVLEPLAEIVGESDALLLAFGKPWQDFADSIGRLLISRQLEHSANGRESRRFLRYSLPGGLHLNVLVTQGSAKPPRRGNPSIDVIRGLLKGGS